MTVYGLWWGGPGYSRPDPDDLERFPSVDSARHALRSRYDSNGIWLQDFDYVTRDATRSLLPAVTHDSEIFLYSSPDADLSCPDRRVYFGPRGGVRTERL